ncbi:MAG: hypothetical protein PHU49_03640 [Syntrophorhabdaceae bacterium]|nr:hypothetical protein [Syntrophorhabdaceae bacterium]MDD5243088.1 hypothetical protein [Syntrophorhabdaceae bacterium]
MARGGYRINSGPVKGTKYGPRGSKKEQKPDIQANAAAENLTPLEYMLKVMRDPNEDKDRRARMAIAAAPFVHPRKGEGQGKKNDKADRAVKAGQGRFSPSKTPGREGGIGGKQFPIDSQPYIVPKNRVYEMKDLL